MALKCSITVCHLVTTQLIRTLIFKSWLLLCKFREHFLKTLYPMISLRKYILYLRRDQITLLSVIFIWKLFEDIKGNDWMFIDSTKPGITCGNGAVATNLSYTVILPPAAAWGLVTHFSHCTSLNRLSGNHGHSSPYWLCKLKLKLKWRQYN